MNSYIYNASPQTLHLNCFDQCKMNYHLLLQENLLNSEKDDLSEGEEEEENKEINDKSKKITKRRKENASSGNSKKSTSHAEPKTKNTKPLQWKERHAWKMSNETDKIIDNEDCHHVLILAFCFSSVNELKNFMYECGVISIAGLKNERGQITNGRYF